MSQVLCGVGQNISSKRLPGQVEKALEMMPEVKEEPSGDLELHGWLSMVFSYEQKQLWISGFDPMVAINSGRLEPFLFIGKDQLIQLWNSGDQMVFSLFRATSQ